VAIVQLGTLDIDVGVLYQHLLPDQKRGEKGGRQFTLVTDDRNLLQGLVRDRQSCVGVWTTNPPLVDVARDFIRHDIFCWKLVSKLRVHVDKTFGEDLALLRDIFCP
jgi:hypothetical protein